MTTYKKKIKKLQTGGDPPTRKPFQPYNTGAVPTYTPEVGPESGFIPTAPINPADIDALAWTQSYVNSPKYRERLSSFFKYPDYIQRQRAAKLSNVGFSEEEDANTAYSDTGSYPNQVRVGLRQLRYDNISRPEAVVHELGHVTNASETSGALRLNPKEERFILDRNKTLTPAQRASFIKGAEGSTLSTFLGEGETHDVAPSETMSDIQALRYFMNKNKIYDARTQDITPELLQRAKKNPEIQKQFSTKRLLENFDDAALLDILNKIAINDNNQPTIAIAKYGKLIPKYQEGGKKKTNKEIPKTLAPNKESLRTSISDLIIPNEETLRKYNPDNAVRNWHLNYINSPKYKERLQKANYKDVDKTIDERRNRIQNTIIETNPSIFGGEGSYYMGANNRLFVDNKQVENLETNRNDILSHEFSHAINASHGEILNQNNPNGGLVQASENLRLNKYEEDYILNRNKRLREKSHLIPTAKRLASEKNQTVGDVLGLIDHDFSPSENKSDIDSFRFILSNEGIYDAGKQDFTPELLEKAKENKNVKKAFNSQRLFKNFSDEDLIDIMNKVAINNQEDIISVAKNGGEIKVREKSNSDNIANDKAAFMKQAEGKRKSQTEYSRGTSETFDSLLGNLGSYFLGTENSGTIPSNYKPTKSKNPNAKYTTWKFLKNDVKDDLLSETFINNINTREEKFAKEISGYKPSFIKDKTFDEFYNFHKNAKNAGSISGSSINLGHYQVRPGEDERGRYFGIYDKYDWNLFEGLGIKSNSFETYDRIYEDEWDKIKGKKEIQNTTNMKNGGLSRDKDYGSKKKPYPSVSKGDFAGGGRSYPIPTKADAVDALRLAGLHGRSDVRAKVFKKYPELKKSKWGTKVMQGGGPIDPTDPEFAIKMQQLLRDNPELAQDIFAPVTSQTPPGVDASQQLTNLQPTDAQQLAWNDPVIPSAPANTTTNTNVDSQQKNQSWKNKTVDLPVGDAIKGLVMGANMLATEYIDNPRKRANEMRLLRRQLAPVQSKPSQGGYDMPILAKSGIQITSAYSNLNIPAAKKPRNPWGNTANQYKTDDPDIANVLVEGGEFLELPDGQTSVILGDSHNDYSGGELMRLPEGSKVYSDSIKVDKEFAKDLVGTNSKKKKTVAQLAKKFDTDHEEGILKDPTSDMISKRSANIMKTFKQGQLQQLFDYQEAVKNPMYLLTKDVTGQDFVGSEDEVIARKGVKVMQEGGTPRRRNPLSPRRQPMYTIQNGIPVQMLPEAEVIGTGRTGFNPATGRFTSNIRPRVITPSSTPRLTTPTSTPDVVPPTSTPEWTPLDLEPIRGKYVLNTIPQGVQPPQLQPLVPPTTIQPGDTPIDPNKPQKPIPDNNKANPPQPSPKVPWGDTLGAFGEITPEIFAMIQNQSDFPIFTAKYQPKYLNPVEMNIQASLNRNYAQTRPLLESSGNPSIDNARAAQAVANLYDANNEMFQQKFNFDTQNRYQTDATNLQIENQANLLNLQRADQFWDKVTARQAVKEATNNNIMNSAYAKFKRKQLEKRSLQLTNQMFDNYKYDPETGIYFDNKGQQFVFHEPSGNFVNIGNSLGDNVKTTKTTRSDNRGRVTQTVKQEERRGS